VQRLSGARGSKAALFGQILLAALLISGPQNLAKVISGVTSVITWPITQQLNVASNRYEVFNTELLLVYIVAVLGLNLVMQSGLVSLGHSAFFGLGAYVVAISTGTWGWSFYLGLPMAALVAGVLGMLLGLPALRLGLYAVVMVTIGYAFVAPDLALQWKSLTGGGNGIRRIEFPPPFDTLENYYWLIVIVVLVVYSLHRNLIRSPFGRASQAIEESEVAARSLGLSPYVAKLRPFGLSAAVAGLAGGLYVPLIGFIAPDSVTVSLAILFVLMVLLGGTGTVAGPIIGAVLLFRLPIEVERVAAQPGDWSLLIYGLLLLLSVFLFPKGLMSAWWVLRQRLRRRRRTTGASTERERAEVSSTVAPVKAEGVMLELRDVHKTLSGVRALNGVDLTLAAGSVHALIGPNGSGKTTLLNIISGYLTPDRGSVLFAGRDAEPSVHARARRGLARTFQTPFVFEGMSCLENVMVALDSHRRHGNLWYALRAPWALREERRHVSRAAAILASVGLGEKADDVAARLPPGERRLLEIGRVVALDPTVVLMDEPAAGLTGVEIDELEEVIRALRTAGIAVLLVEHHVGFVLRLADTVTVVDFGKVIARGLPTEITKNPTVIAAYLGGEIGSDAPVADAKLGSVSP
jgi:branched-chain amino acid transport system permease protein